MTFKKNGHNQSLTSHLARQLRWDASAFLQWARNYARSPERRVFWVFDVNTLEWREV